MSELIFFIFSLDINLLNSQSIQIYSFIDTNSLKKENARRSGPMSTMYKYRALPSFNTRFLSSGKGFSSYLPS